jgi:MFS family permease
MNNIRLFIAFRVLFNARWYYPVMAVLFLDLGLSLAEYALLNVAWAVTIVCLEVPSGALADQIGRRRMVVLAAWLMVAEMLLFAFAPAGSAWLFPVLILNRILSGAAEACASGADEALAYDSLVDAGKTSEWPAVLARLMRWQAVGFFVAMLGGAAVFDANLMNAASKWVGWDINLRAETTLRIPLFLTLANAWVVLVIALQMREPHAGSTRVRATIRGTLTQTFRAARWTLSGRAVLFVMLAGLCVDCVIRLFLTVNSNYYRLIGLPDASFGLIASAFAVLGFFTPRLSKEMVSRFSFTTNFAWVAGLAIAGLGFAAMFLHGWGVVVVIPIGISMSMLGFFVSHYLNTSITDSSLRTTVLSFKGLLFNLAYGGIGALFAGFTALWAHSSDQDAVFIEALRWLPGFLVVILLPVVVLGMKLRHTRIG